MTYEQAWYWSRRKWIKLEREKVTLINIHGQGSICRISKWTLASSLTKFKSNYIFKVVTKYMKLLGLFNYNSFLECWKKECLFCFSDKHNLLFFLYSYLNMIFLILLFIIISLSLSLSLSLQIRKLPLPSPNASTPIFLYSQGVQSILVVQEYLKFVTTIIIVLLIVAN